MSAGDRFDVSAWAESQQSTQQGTACVTCQNRPAAEAIRTVLLMMVEGKSRASIPGMHKMLVVQYGYLLSENGLRGHIKRCEADLWARVTSVREGE